MRSIVVIAATWLLPIALSPLHAEYITISGRAFGTSYMVKAIDKARSADEPSTQESLESSLASRIEQRLDEIDRAMSTYRDDSEVSRFNQADPGVWFSVGQETAKLVQRALEISEKTDGAFDVTVGPAVGLWNFGADAGQRFKVPSDDQITEVLTRVGHEKLLVRLDPPAIQKTTTGVQLDLSAIAKGYAVDAIAELLNEFPNFMVEIGGEVRVKGSRDLGNGWRIGLESPDPNRRKVDSVVTLHDQALATSGDYRNFHVHDGAAYSHTIDPRTARPVTHALAAVSVIADNCADADAYATALLVMGVERGKPLAEANQLQVLMTTRDSSDLQSAGVSTAQLTKVATDGFPSEPTSNPNGFVTTFLVTAAVFGIAVLAMSVGTIVANRRLQGSCGGMSNIKDSGGNTICDMCTRPSSECTGQPTPGHDESHA